jgi:hypothetical protein
MRFQWRILMEKIQGWCTYRRTRYSPWVFDVVAECYKFNVPCQKCLICYESQIFSVKNAGSRTFRLLHLIGGKLIMFNHACIWRQSKGWFNECKNLGIYIICNSMLKIYRYILFSTYSWKWNSEKTTKKLSILLVTILFCTLKLKIIYFSI